MRAAPVTYAGEPLWLSRTGYTGERGYELLVAWDLAAKLWDELFERGEPLGAVPAGLGARDTLRLEMGYPLHGNDISPQTDPFEARVGWAVAMGKPDFRGHDALVERKAAGTRRLLVGLVSTDRLIPRHGMAVLAGDQWVGEVTSGTFSPSLRHGRCGARDQTAIRRLLAQGRAGAGLVVGSADARQSARCARRPLRGRPPAARQRAGSDGGGPARLRRRRRAAGRPGRLRRAWLTAQGTSVVASGSSS